MKNYYYQKAIKNYSAILLDIFNDIQVQVTDDDSVTHTKNVPCTWTPKEKLFYFLKEDHDTVALDTSLPKIAVYLDSIDIAMERSLNNYTYRRFILSKSAADRHRDRMPCPFNFIFGVSIFTKYTDHMAQVLENIIPWFNPSIVVKVLEQGLLNTETVREIPITLQSVVPNVQNEYTESERRIIQSDLSFMLEGWIYKPLSSGTNIIYDFTGNVIDYTNIPIVSGGYDSETVSVSGSGTVSDPTYTKDLNENNDNMGA